MLRLNVPVNNFSVMSGRNILRVGGRITFPDEFHFIGLNLILLIMPFNSNMIFKHMVHDLTVNICLY